jgi:hypothetical protein
MRESVARDRETSMRKPKSRRDEPGWPEGIAKVRRVVESIAANCPPTPEAAQRDGTCRAESFAEADLFRYEIAYKLQAFICADPRRCAKHRCRRQMRCRELAEIGRLLEETRTLVERERNPAGKPPEERTPGSGQRKH